MAAGAILQSGHATETERENQNRHTFMRERKETREDRSAYSTDTDLAFSGSSFRDPSEACVVVVPLQDSILHRCRSSCCVTNLLKR